MAEDSGALLLSLEAGVEEEVAYSTFPFATGACGSASASEDSAGCVCSVSVVSAGCGCSASVASDDSAACGCSAPVVSAGCGCSASVASDDSVG